VDEPRGFVHTGGATAAPVFARVAAAALARDGILTEPELPLPEWARADWVPPWKIAAPKPAATTTAVVAAVASAPPKPAETPRLPAAPPAVRSTARSEPQASKVHRLDDRILLPDFRGLTPEEVRRQLSGLGIVIQVSGSGRAVAQEPAPGTILRGGSVRVHFGAAGGAR